MKTYRIIRNWLGVIEAYVCKEDSDIVIKVERGSLSSDRPSGYVLYYKEELVCTWMTLRECKEAAEELEINKSTLL